MSSNVGNKVTVDRSTSLPTPSAPWEMVADRFATSLDNALELLNLLTGTGTSSGGYLGELNNLIDNSAPEVSLTAPDVSTDITIASVKDSPKFNKNILGTFDDFTIPDPHLMPLPSIDISDLNLPTTPTEINPEISWTELNLNQDIYRKLLTRISDDLVYGATGLTAEVQEDIFNSGIFRQKRINDRAYQRSAQDIAGRGSTIPTGAYVTMIGEISGDILDQESELNRTITINQSELAQKNSQFVINIAKDFEIMLRETRNQESNRALDYAKTKPLLLVQIYAEKVKMYVAIAEANRAYVLTQVENLKAIVANNTALIDQYQSTIQAYGMKIDAVAKKNASLVDVYRGEIAGYDSETNAISRTDSIKIEKIKTDLTEADLVLRAAIEEAKLLLAGYTSESALKEKIADDMAGIANQAMVGLLSSVNANASLGYHGSESTSENWSHSDQLGENHSYPHDSTT